jgi:hypothetical protein
MATGMQQFLVELRDYAAAVNTLKTEFQTLKDNVSRMAQVMGDQDGKGGIATRVALLERDTDALRSWRRNAERDRRDKKEDEQKNPPSNQVLITLIVALAGVATSVLSFFKQGDTPPPPPTTVPSVLTPTDPDIKSEPPKSEIPTPPKAPATKQESSS